jgi:ribosomal protein S18 acetylase RimI-like enzyme
MSIEFCQVFLTPKVQKLIFQGLQDYGKIKKGFAGDHLDEPPTSFEAWDQGVLAGALVVKKFWGQMHIRSLYVETAYRGQHIATTLMKRAMDLAVHWQCDFIFVETLNFQALNFYKKMGFDQDFVRYGYAQGTSFHYLRKNLQ